MIALIDYGAGNLTSVRKAFAALNADICIPAAPADLERASAVVVPGVGHFAATAALGPEWIAAIRASIERGRPLFGICLGMQWLFDGSDEATDCPGLGVLAGRCRRLSGVDASGQSLKVPHVGWNEVHRRGEPTLLDGVRSCSVCHAITDQELCANCSDPQRSDRTICVVEEPHDVVAIEKTRDYRGRYHVLHGALSPLSGVGPDELRIQGLLDRVRAIPGVRDAAVSEYLPMEGRELLEVPVRVLSASLPEAGQRSDALVVPVTPAYFAVLGTRAAGRHHQREPGHELPQVNSGPADYPGFFPRNNPQSDEQFPVIRILKNHMRAGCAKRNSVSRAGHRSSKPACQSHTLTNPSLLQETSRLPSGWKLTPETEVAWPRRVLRTRPPDATSHKLTLPSWLPVAIHLPSRLKAAQRSGLAGSVHSSREPSASHTLNFTF